MSKRNHPANANIRDKKTDFGKARPPSTKMKDATQIPNLRKTLGKELKRVSVLHNSIAVVPDFLAADFLSKEEKIIGQLSYISILLHSLGKFKVSELVLNARDKLMFEIDRI